MKLETEIREDHQARVVVEFEPELLDNYRRKAAHELAKEKKVPGFRPGKAPYEIIRSLFGDEVITHQAMDMIIDDYYVKVLEEAKLNPSAPGSLDEVISEDPLTVAFLVPLQPEIILGDYHSIRKEYTPPQVEEGEVEQVLKRMQADNAVADIVDRPVEDGDLVYIRLKGTLSNPAEGEDPEFIHERPVQVIVGENEIQADDWPFPGFSKEIIGLKAKDEKEVTYKYADDYADEALKGKEAIFHITIQSVKKLTLPELNDEFAQTNGEHQTLEELRKAISEYLLETKTEDYDREYDTSLIDEVVKSATIKYPPQVLEEEIEEVIHTFEDQLESQRLDLETYLKLANKDRQTFIEEEAKPIAIRRLERSLVIEQLSKSENIILDEQIFGKIAEEVLNEVKNNEHYKKLSRQKQLELSKAITYQRINQLMNDKIRARMRSIATGQPEETTESESEGNKPSENQDSIAEAESKEKE